MEIYLISGNKKEKWNNGIFKGEKGKAISMSANYIDNEKRFAENEMITFSEKEFSDLCLFFSSFANEIHKSIIQYAKETGHQLNIKNNNGSVD